VLGKCRRTPKNSVCGGAVGVGPEKMGQRAPKISLLLQAAERYLGNFIDWPADILELLFIHYPTPKQMRKFLAFFYGNGAPCPLVSQLFHACNSHSTANDTQTIYDTYEKWEKNQTGRHISKYYNLRLRKCLPEWKTGESTRAGAQPHGAPTLRYT
jgi:hypothetical protein